MDELRSELQGLVRDICAHLEDARATGVLEEPVEPSALSSAPSSAPSPTPASVAAVEPSPPPAPKQVARWEALAAQGRQREERDDHEASARLRAVRQELGDCRRCGLCAGRRNLVFGVGNPAADLVIVGEGPGREEDQRGEPFVGKAGQMLDRMLANVLGLKREQVYICNVVKCRPPANRNPTPDEVATCRPFLEAQIQAIQPKVLLVLGSVALKAMFSDEARITRDRGRWRTWNDIPTLPTFHPAYLLRKPEDKRKTFEDLKLLKQRHDMLTTGGATVRKSFPG